MQALLGAARSERSTAVRRSYAQAAATIVKYAAEARAAKFVTEATALYTDPGAELTPENHVSNLECWATSTGPTERVSKLIVNPWHHQPAGMCHAAELCS